MMKFLRRSAGVSTRATRRMRMMTSAAMSGLVLLGACDDADADLMGPVRTPAYVEATTALDLGTGTVATAVAAPIRVVARDQFGRLVPNANITWRASGGSVPSLVTATDANGAATTTWTLGTAAGEQTLTASVADGGTAVFRINAQAGAVQSVSIMAGAQQQVARGAVSEPLAVRAIDQFGNGVPFVTVSWTSTGGLLADARTQTDANGVAWTTLVAGAQAGTSTVTASLPNGVTRAFTITTP